MNRVIISGNVAADPEFRTTASGVPVCNFRVAVNRKYKNQRGKYDSDFFGATAFMNTAEYCGKYMQKGTRCIIEGALQSRTYDAQDGSKRYVVEIVVDNVEIVSRGRGQQEQKPEPTQEPGFTQVEDELPF